MEGKGNRGAYAQVTAPIEDDSKVTIEQGGKSQGMHACSTQKRLIIAVLVAVAVIAIIIIVAVIVTKMNNKSELSVQGTTKTTVAPTVTQAMVHVTSIMSQSTMPMDAVTMAPSPPPTTFGPAVAGLFEGTFVLDRAYDHAFDDVRAALTTDFKANITAAMDQIFREPDAPYMYVNTIVDQLLQNGTNVQVEFTVSLDAINRGGRAHLLTALGSSQSTKLATYRVLYASIQEEKKPSLDA